jgi:hypothetical protein
MYVPSLGTAPARRRYPAVILAEGGEKVVGSEPDAAAAPEPTEHPVEHPGPEPVEHPTEHPASDPTEPSADQPASTEQAPAPRRRIVRRLPSSDRVLPDITSDERDAGWGEVPEPDDDEHLLRDVPPHHGS